MCGAGGNPQGTESAHQADHREGSKLKWSREKTPEGTLGRDSPSPIKEGPSPGGEGLSQTGEGMPDGEACRRSPHLRPTTCKAANSSGAERNTRWYSGMGEPISNSRGPVSRRRGPVSKRRGHRIQRRNKLGAPEALFKSDVGRHSTSCDGRNSPPLK